MTRPPNSARSDRSARQREAFEDLVGQRWEILRSHLGPRYESCRVETFDVTDADPQYAAAKRQAVAQVREYLADIRENVRTGRNVMFNGPKGTGKDHLMVGMLYEAVHDGANCKWWDGMTLYAELRRCVREKQSEGPILDKLLKADVVAISDPLPPRGASVTEFIADFMFRLVDGRYRKRRPVWVTENISSREEGEERLAPQIHDRLRDGAIQVRCNWPSYRRPEE